MSLKIEDWKDEYYLPRCDGTLWELDYKLYGVEVKHIEGSNDYPQDWIKFIDLVEEFHLQLISLHDGTRPSVIDIFLAT